MSKIKTVIIVNLVFVLCSCSGMSSFEPVIPAAEYAKKIRAQQDAANQSMNDHQTMRSVRTTPMSYEPRAAARMAKGMPDDRDLFHERRSENPQRQAYETNVSEDQSFYMYESQMPGVRDYRSPLPLGDPGISASLWQESRGGNDLFRDHRAFQPMDLITIRVSERTEGSNEADSEIKSQSSFAASIQNFLGLERDLAHLHRGLDPTALVQAGASSQFKGEGDTQRRGRLTGTISAMVVEVLPSGVLRVEGEKIVSVNQEEQIMVLSGLVRPRDVNSINEVDSSKIANVRIDYFGKGIIAEGQHGGWMSRFLRTVWPF